MENVIVGVSIVLALTAIFGAGKGFDLRTRKGWFFVLCGFLSGFLFFLIGNKGLFESTFLGLFISFIITIRGLSMNRKRGRYKEFLDD